MLIRHVTESDYAPIITVLDAWWGGRHMSDMLPKLFFKHFKDTSFIVEEDGAILGFIIGFVSQTYPTQAYVHFTGVHPDHRKRGIGKQLYSAFTKAVKEKGCDSVHLVTSPVNKTSIAFHTHIGFQIEKGDTVIDGISVNTGYDGPGEDRVVFIKNI